jgi:hypothetical protein
MVGHPEITTLSKLSAEQVWSAMRILIRLARGRCSRTPEQGAVVTIRLAQLDNDGPTGLVFEDEMQLMW